ncbi:S8 family peptidase [Streptomyces sp. NPDC001663]|uniref:S8 family peptidase n=1 Tax=Streptomyces sp. NPDC001663 TaxID=3364597 RepID=UPI0036AAFB4A
MEFSDRRGGPADPAEQHRQLEDLIFRKAPLRRFTQDSPVLPDVWFAYGQSPHDKVDLLLTPMRGTNPGEVFRAVHQRLAAERESDHWRTEHGQDRESVQLAYSQSTVAVRLWFDELVRVVLPLSAWQAEYRELTDRLAPRADSESEADRALAEAVERLEAGHEHADPRDNAVWMVSMIGTIELRRTTADTGRTAQDASAKVRAARRLLDGAGPLGTKERPLIFSVGRNRGASATVWRSSQAVKADAARRVFELRCDALRWAVLDSGIDATHPAFRMRDATGAPHPTPFGSRGGDANRTRVLATYDFTQVRTLLDPDSMTSEALTTSQRRRLRESGQRISQLRRHLYSGRQIDWDLFAPLLEIDHRTGAYRPPVHPHGTHVAGILAGDWRRTDGGPGAASLEHDLIGLCPDLPLYDIRVLDDQGQGDEFSIIAALQFVRHLNAHQDHVVVHGANLSLSIPHDVANYACGRTPVCEECERLVDTGVIVVTPAGNEGYAQQDGSRGIAGEGYRSVSITDPGNAQGVITVGATHRYRPHTYGVSYFSSRGPTGDGRAKPDLVAPGEKIWSAVPGEDIRSLDGTSMAAPHVSGSAALLLARHHELIGEPERVKDILCRTATDLGREPYFQGKGMVDVLRAIQSV